MDGQNQHSSQFHETLNFEQLNCLLELLSNYLNNNLTEHQSELNSNERFKDVLNQYFRFNGSVYTINQLMSMVRHNEKVSKISRSKSSSSSVTEHEFDHISDSFSINPNGNTIISPLLNYSEQRPIVQYVNFAHIVVGIQSTRLNDANHFMKLAFATMATVVRTFISNRLEPLNTSSN
ncbi:hypothetical protein RDWZM_005961 [Blomia tropicalis]|uniref:Uncharacterized protein n=1 Tax=Blomia tropicalis TaxID=40697 RepID=A0A9Q0RMV3_BLOTA|nr:hypothetical protein RDWZM_005961 [Blomia tropicalis]